MTLNTFTLLLKKIKLKPGISILLIISLLPAAIRSNAQDVLVGLTSNGGAEGKGTAYSVKTDGKSFGVIKGFSDYGSYPVGDLVQGTDGAFYGMTPNGGTYNSGTLFRITSSGDIKVLKHFNYNTDGGNPLGSLISGKDGAFYGTVSNGGSNSGGVIFKFTTAGVYTVLRSLLTNSDGGHPYCRLVQAKDGYLYGTTYNGGVNGYGTVFKMSATGTSYTVLHAFKNSSTDGGYPYGSIIQGTDGAFYGMTHSGGTGGWGIVYKITTTGTFTILRNLNGSTDGQYPNGSLVQAKDGYLYGMTSSGGTNYAGTIFKISTTGTSFTVLKQLSAGTTGSNPQGGLIQAADGYLYGLTQYSPSGTAGEVFKISTSGSLTVMHKFTDATEGGFPHGGLVQGTDGSFYGMTYSGGKNTYGTVFKMTATGTTTIINHFNNDVNGLSPQDKLAIGKDSAYFGVTRDGGLNDAGTIFKICGGVTTILRSLNRSTDGATPLGGLVRGTDGNLYGTTSYGGKNGVGTIYKITPTGTFTVIRHLTSTTDGAYPEAALAAGTDGMLYGTAPSGGTGGYGTIFKINTTGTTFKVLRNFTSATDAGAYMKGSLMQAKDGYLYGVTTGTTKFFKISTAGIYTVLHSFVYATEGGSPKGSLIQGSDGAFYGTNANGGASYNGTIYKITSTGSVTILHSFGGTPDGKIPFGSLVQGSDGAFYGTASAGGTYNAGTIFRVTTSKTFTVLRHLNMATDGGAPTAGLIVAPKIALTATAQSSVTTNEDVSKSITLSGAGATSLTYAIVTPPKNGSVTSGTSALRVYTPNANYNGKDSFAFVTNYGCLSSSLAWVKIAVNSVNDAPVLATIGNKTIATGATLTFTATATDPDAGQTKTFSLISAPSGAAINATSGVFTWKPSGGGTYTLKVRVTDNGSPALYDEEQITVTVTNTVAASSIASKSSITDVPFVTKTPVLLEARIYPNPVNDRFTIAFNTSVERVLAMITDIKGVTMQSQNHQLLKARKLDMNVADLKPGVYFLQLQTELGKQTLKFVKM